MEIKRFLSRKVVLVGLIILLLQSLFFINEQVADSYYVDFTRFNQEYNAIVCELIEMDLKAALLKLNNMSFSNEKLKEELVEKVVYLYQYPESINNILDNAVKMQSMDIFQVDDSYVKFNIEQTIYDFGKVAKLEPLLDRDRVTQSIVKYSYLSYFTLAYTMYIIFNILKERDNGLWDLLHSMRQGRGALAWRRFCSLIVTSIIFYAVAFFLNIVCAWFMYGADDFTGCIQTISLYSRYTEPISKGNYLVLLLVKSIFGIGIITAFSFCIFTLFKSRYISIIMTMAIIIVQWQAWLKIPQSNIFSIIKNLNLYKFIHIPMHDMEYVNVRFFGLTVSKDIILYGGGLLFTIILLTICIAVYEKRYSYNKKESYFMKKINLLLLRSQRIVLYLTASAKEVYKSVVLGRGYLYIIGGFILFLMVSQKTMINFPDMQQHMDEVYKEYGGSDWTGFYQYINDLEIEISDKIKMADIIMIKFKNGDTESADINEAMRLRNTAETQMKCLEEYYTKLERKEEAKQITGTDIYLMSDRGYNEILGKNSFIRESMIGIVLIILTVWSTIHTIDLEDKEQVKPLLRLSKIGLKNIWIEKLKGLLFLSIFYVLLFLGGNFLLLYKHYNMPFIHAPIQSLGFMAMYSLNISIAQYMILLTFYRVIVVFGTIGGTLMLVSHSDNANKLYIPIILGVFSVVYILIPTANSPLLLVIFMIGMLIIAAVGYPYSFFKWCDNR